LPAIDHTRRVISFDALQSGLPTRRLAGELEHITNLDTVIDSPGSVPHPNIPTVVGVRVRGDVPFAVFFNGHIFRAVLLTAQTWPLLCLFHR